MVYEYGGRFLSYVTSVIKHTSNQNIHAHILTATRTAQYKFFYTNSTTESCPGSCEQENKTQEEAKNGTCGHRSEQEVHKAATTSERIPAWKAPEGWRAHSHGFCLRKLTFGNLGQ